MRSWNINYRLLIKWVIPLVLAAAVFSVSCSDHRKSKVAHKPPTPMNIVFITIDTLRADHLGCYGYKRKTSPNIDAFAKKSVLFKSAYTHSPWTLASHASMFTSLDPRDLGIRLWSDPLQEQFETLPEFLKSHGYATYGCISMYGLGEGSGLDQGYDIFNGEISENVDVFNGTTSSLVTDSGIEALNSLKNDLFFVWLHYYDPHDEYLNHDEYDFGRRKEDNYDEEIAFTDHHIGRLLKHLYKTGLMDRTIVVIVADHGEALGERSAWGHSSTLFEEVMHIPLIIYIPGFTGQMVEPVVAETDIAPTLIRLIGLSVPDFYSGIPISFDENGFNPAANRTVMMENYLNDECRQGIYKKPWKLLFECNVKEYSLFNLESDPVEIDPCELGINHEEMVLHNMLTGYFDKIPIPVKSRQIDGKLKNTLKSLGYLNK